MPSRLAAFAGGLLAVAVATAAPAQDASRPIHMVIAFPPGGPTDFVGRLVADKAKDILGQPIIIENKPGANGAIGADYVAKSPPDGSTLFLTTMGAVVVTRICAPMCAMTRSRTSRRSRRWCSTPP